MHTVTLLQQQWRNVTVMYHWPMCISGQCNVSVLPWPNVSVQQCSGSGQQPIWPRSAPFFLLRGALLYLSNIYLMYRCNQFSQDWHFLTYSILLKYPRVTQVRGCSHITSAKNRGSYTPPPPSVSNGQHLADPPSPLRQQWSAFSLPPLPPSSAFVSIFPPAPLYYNFRRRIFDIIKWGIFIC